VFHTRFAACLLSAVLTLATLQPLPALAAPGPTATVIAAQVDPAIYQHYLEDLLFTHLGDNRGFGPQHDLARANIVATLESFGLNVALEPFVYNTVNYYNVVATQTGRDLPGQICVVGAHFDSVNNPGADDNGTGTALVMEMARILSRHRTAKTIRYVLFDREEQGLRGSTAYVASHAGENTIMAVTADMVGHDSGAYGMDIYGRPASSSVVNGVAFAIDEFGGSLNRFLNFGTFNFSDHAPFENAGIPACVIIERNYNLNTHYHQPTDAVDIAPDYIDYNMVTDLCRSVAGYLVQQLSITLWGDFDFDADVDLADHTYFADCMAGPDAAPSPALPGVTTQACLGYLDFDGDNDVDLVDFAAFEGYLAEQ
jgi:hypothetical protein